MYICRNAIGEAFAQALCAAIECRDEELVRSIVARFPPHALVNYRDSSPHRRSFLHLACDMDSYAIMKIFLAFGVPADITDGRIRTCLHSAKTPEMVEVLCEHGATRHLVDEDGYTPLHVYVCTEKAACVSAILKHDDVRMNALLPLNRWSALHIAASMGNTEITQLLLTQSRSAVDLSRQVHYSGRVMMYVVCMHIVSSTCFFVPGRKVNVSVRVNHC